jgi:hypothetical protein
VRIGGRELCRCPDVWDADEPGAIAPAASVSGERRGGVCGRYRLVVINDGQTEEMRAALSAASRSAVATRAAVASPAQLWVVSGGLAWRVGVRGGLVSRVGVHPAGGCLPADRWRLGEGSERERQRENERGREGEREGKRERDG